MIGSGLHLCWHAFHRTRADRWGDERPRPERSHGHESHCRELHMNCGPGQRCREIHARRGRPVSIVRRVSIGKGQSSQGHVGHVTGEVMRRIRRACAFWEADGLSQSLSTLAQVETSEAAGRVWRVVLAGGVARAHDRVDFFSFCSSSLRLSVRRSVCPSVCLSVCLSALRPSPAPRLLAEQLCAPFAGLFVRADGGTGWLGVPIGFRRLVATIIFI